jgi:hypothetical protein
MTPLLLGHIKLERLTPGRGIVHAELFPLPDPVGPNALE